MTSNRDRAYVITVSVAPVGHEGLAAESVDGTVTEYSDASEIADIPEEDLSRAVSVRPVGDAAETRIHRWPGPQGTTAVFENVSRESTFFYSIAYPSGDEPMQNLGSASCGSRASLEELTLRINGDGSVVVSNNCVVD